MYKYNNISIKKSNRDRVLPNIIPPNDKFKLS